MLPQGQDANHKKGTNSLSVLPGPGEASVSSMQGGAWCGVSLEMGSRGQVGVDTVCVQLLY